MAVVILTASSCEDMFKVDSKVVLYDDENTLDQATDTVYSVLGIINKMQKIADDSTLTEAENDALELFGEERLMEMVKHLDAASDEKAVVEQVYRSVNTFAAGHPQNDDITIMSIKV